MSRIKDMIEVDPLGFDFASLELPPSITSNAEVLEDFRAKAEQHLGKVTSGSTLERTG